MNELITLPFDSIEGNIKEYSAAQRRMLYHDLWSDMILERFTFENVGSGIFIVNGVAFVGGAYARFNNFRLSTAGVQVGWTHLVLRIVSDGMGGETVGFRFIASTVTGDLRVGTVTIQAGPQVTNIVGVGLSPIRIPDRTIAGTKLGDHIIVNRHFTNGSVTSAVLANDSVTNSRIANSAVTASKIANRAVTADKLPADLFRRVDITSLAASNFIFAAGSRRQIEYPMPAGWGLIGYIPRQSWLSFSFSGSTTITMRNLLSVNQSIGANYLYVSLILCRTNIRTIEASARSTTAM